jgi:sec-independent protein translocase protein TatA
MPQIGPAEIIVILLVGLLVFGPKRLPEIGRQVGRGMRELRRFQDVVKGELDEVLHFGDDHDTNGASPSVEPSISAAETPPALPPASTDPAPPTPATVRPGSRAPSRFRAPGPRPTA